MGVNNKSVNLVKKYSFNDNYIYDLSDDSIFDFSLFFKFIHNLYAWAATYVVAFLKFLILFLILTIVIASVTLIERKYYH